MPKSRLPTSRAAFDYDVVVVGAGVAGMSCANVLLSHGLRTLVVEARDRIGGRVFTLPYAGFDSPVELGAEFMHGAPHSLRLLLESTREPFLDVCDSHVWAQGGRFRPVPDYWDRIGRVVKRLGHARRDRSVAAGLAALHIKDGLTREIFRSYVEGFHSANLLRIGERGLRSSEQSEVSELNGAKVFRLSLGYGPLFQNIVNRIGPGTPWLRLHTRLKRVAALPRGHLLSLQSAFGGALESIKTRRLVVTVPIGVLKASATAESGIRWEGGLPPEVARALAAVEMGDAHRLVFRFRSRFWESLSDEKLAFLHAPADRYFPTWWTQLPIRTRDLVAWQGGPRARFLSQMPLSEKVRIALETLSEITGWSAVKLEREVEQVYTHDWTQDPNSLGAYSYVRPQGLRAAQRLAEPGSNSLYFAGEGTAAGAERGTVHGAWNSGLRAARQILKTTRGETTGTSLGS